MGYIIIDEEKLKDRINQWNDKSYREKVEWDVSMAKADYSHMLEALQQAEKEFDEKIQALEEKKKSVTALMQYAK